MDWICTVLFIIDMAVILCTAYFDSDGLIVTDRRKIAVRYLLRWFIVDLFAALPLGALQYATTCTAVAPAQLALMLVCWWSVDLFFPDIGDGSNRLGRATRVPRAIRIFRLLRLMKLSKYVTSPMRRLRY